MAQRGRPFKPGNKFGRGRPRGSRNKKTILIEELLAENSQSLVRKALELAHQGDVSMLRFLLDRVLPRPKEEPIKIGPLPMATPEELLQAQAKVTQALTSGQITLNQAEQIFALIENVRRLLETQNLEQRVRNIEELFQREEPDKAA
jgi:hypothetical protein